jgi:hypothetical protein
MALSFKMVPGDKKAASHEPQAARQLKSIKVQAASNKADKA